LDERPTFPTDLTMAVRVLPRSQARSTHRSARVSPVVLALVLVPVAIDLLCIIQPALTDVLRTPCAVAVGAATLSLLTAWLRFPRTTWLAAAVTVSAAGLALRLNGVPLAAILSLLAIVALGLGGAFASSEFAQVDA
jgi:hypothetical protein